MMARKFALRAEQRKPLLDAVAAGALLRDAMASVGIPWSTWSGWSRDVKAGTCEDADIVSLVEAVYALYAKRNVSLTASIAVAAPKDWRAASWLLEHRGGDPKRRHDEKRARYEAEIARNRAAGTHVETVRHVGELTDDDLRSEARKLLDALDADDPRTTH